MSTESQTRLGISLGDGVQLTAGNLEELVKTALIFVQEMLPRLPEDAQERVLGERRRKVFISHRAEDFVQQFMHIRREMRDHLP